MPANISSMAPCKMGATVLPVVSYGFGPGLIKDVHKHSGNLFGTLVRLSGAEPMITLQIPFAPAYTALGFGITQLSTFEFQLAQFSNYVRGTNNATKWGLTTNCKAAALITDFTCELDGVFIAEVSVWPLAVGTTHPLTQTDDVALLTLASQPTLHTLGPTVINGTYTPGTNSLSGALGHALRPYRHDGDLYPRNAGLLGGDPTLGIEHVDPKKVLNGLGLLGANITADVVQYFRRYDPTTGIISGDSGSGVSITAASGRVSPGDFSVAHGDLPRQGITVDALSADATHPFAVSLSATVPEVV